MSVSPRSRRPRPSVRPRLSRSRPTRAAGASAAPLGRPTVREAGRAALAGLEGVLLAWVLLLLPVLVSYAMTATAPALGDADWKDAVGIATSAHVLGSGGAVDATIGEDPARLSLAPLGLSLLLVVCVRAAVRRAGVRRPSTAAAAAASVALTTLALSFLAAHPTERPVMTAVSLLLGAIGTLWAAPHLLRTEVWPWWLREGLRAAATAAVALGAVALGATLVAAVLGRDQLAELTTAVAPSAGAAVLLWLAQLLLVPNLAVWALSFLAGPGFAVGEGSRYTSTEVVTGPVPALPALGALPHAGTPAYGWLVVLVLVVGALVGARWWRRRRDPRETAAGLGVTVAAVGVGGVLVGAIASGSGGPGLLARVGVSPWLFGLALALEVGVPAALVLGVGLLRDRRLAAAAEEPDADGAAPTDAVDDTPEGEDVPDAAPAETITDADTEATPDAADDEAEVVVLRDHDDAGGSESVDAPRPADPGRAERPDAAR